MYIARKNNAPSPEATIEFIKKYGFATLVCSQSDNLQAVHIPLEVKQEEDIFKLSGHISLANPIKEYIESNSNVLAIFCEPHAYISSSWYDHINVPTWNYIAIHAYGKFRKIEGEELLDSIKTMVNHYETGRKDRYHVEDMPEDMLRAHLNGLVAFEIEVTKLEANYKLSQNRNDKNYNAIIDKLALSDNMLDREIAKEMRNLRPE